MAILETSVHSSGICVALKPHNCGFQTGACGNLLGKCLIPAPAPPISLVWGVTWAFRFEKLSNESNVPQVWEPQLREVFTLLQEYETDTSFLVGICMSNHTKSPLPTSYHCASCLSHMSYFKRSCLFFKNYIS